MLNFAIVFKNFDYFCPILILTIITWQRILSLADGFHDRTAEAKEVRSLKTSQFELLSFLNDLITTKARKLELAE